MTEFSDSSRKPTSIVAIGVGNRMRTYMHYVASHPEVARLVAVVEPDSIRRNAMADQFDIPEKYRYKDYRDYFKNPVEADVAFICTPEREHFEPCMEALRLGMHVLLEKPVAQTYEQCRLIDRAAKKAGKMVSVCHVLRYHPAFIKVKELVSSGKYGRIMTITHTEDVGIDRMTHSYVRGAMNTEAGNNPMLLAKCCHDIDFLVWLTDSNCKRLSSFGNRVWFRRENAPEGSATRCVNCSIEKECPYSAIDLYWRRRQWINNFDVPAGMTLDQVLSKELDEGVFGRCVYHCDNDVVDSQVMTMQMEDGSLITLCMDAFTRRDGRSTDIKMTHGEIVSDGVKIFVTDFLTGKREVYDFTEVCKQPFHAGADIKLVEGFLAAVRGDASTELPTTIADSLRSHRLCFEAERSRHTGTTITFTE
ncbi:MAG: Gfo/Idh/MocA family oxidoreductase [Muribaculaceae bacterium]|nr:Gfo/Idh/MocA family oxidoreductase [Muribaculaceae bacterium]